MEQATVVGLLNEQAGITHKKVIVMFERSSGDIILVDASEDGAFFKGATVNHSYVVVAFMVPTADLEGKGGRPCKLQKIRKTGDVYGFFKNYRLTSV